MVDYFLPHHVHFCCRGDALVFLDLRRDAYTLVNGAAAIILRTFYLQSQTDDRKPECLDALNELLESELLTTRRDEGKDIVPTRIDLALEPLVDPEVMPEVRMTAGHLWEFFFACTTAAAQLRWSSLEHSVNAIRQRKDRHSDSGHIDLAKARELTAIFHKLRFLFPLKYVCLYDSLALIEFLARYAVYPTWVFGIKLEPWAAHCWVQESRFIFNEGVEEAAGYSPVMAV